MAEKFLILLRLCLNKRDSDVLDSNDAGFNWNQNEPHSDVDTTVSEIVWRNRFSR